MADIDVLMPLIKQFMPFAKEQMGFDRPPELFLKGDSSNAADPLGKTGFYDPQAGSITLYITDRHPKDILRSLSHELMHHTQNCRGDFDDTGEMGEGYAQSNPHMRNMEIEAYKASICFRDWEDSLRETIYYEHLQKGDKTMSIKDWKNGEIKTLLSEAWGFKMDLNKLNESAPADHKGKSKVFLDEKINWDKTYKKPVSLPSDTRYDDADAAKVPEPVDPRGGSEATSSDHLAQINTQELADKVGALGAASRAAQPLPATAMDRPAGLGPGEISSDELTRLADLPGDATKIPDRAPSGDQNDAVWQDLDDLGVEKTRFSDESAPVITKSTDTRALEDFGEFGPVTLFHRAGDEERPGYAAVADQDAAETPRQIRKASRQRAKAVRRQGREDASAAKFTGKETDREESFAAKQAAKATRFAKRQAARKADSRRHPVAGEDFAENKTRNGQLSSILSETWGFDMDLNKLNEDFADQHRTAGNTLDEEEGLEEQRPAGLKSRASSAFDDLDTQPAPAPVATKPTPVPKPEPVATKPTKADAFSALDKGLETKPAGLMGIPAEYIGDKGAVDKAGDELSDDYGARVSKLPKKESVDKSLDEMCGPEHDGAEVVIMGDEEGVVGDEAADPAERVAALMDELKDLLMQLAGGGDMEEVPMDEKHARGRRDARHVVGREDDDRKRPGDMSEAREVKLRAMVRKAIKEAMK